MIKFTGKDEDGSPMIGLVIDDENIRRMKDKRPLSIDLSELLPTPVPAKIRLFVYFEKDLEKVASELKPRAKVVKETKAYKESGFHGRRTN